jgi:hypothetical protein
MAGTRVKRSALSGFLLLSSAWALAACKGGEEPPAMDLSAPADLAPPAPDLTTPTCTDGVKNGMETDTDCGGPTCPACAVDRPCLESRDCAAGVCDARVCRLPRSCQELLVAHPQTLSGVHLIDADGPGAAAGLRVRCEMGPEGGWTLVYNRVNAYFTPDHMVNRIPAVGPTEGDNSTAWFIPLMAERWRWEVSVDSGATYRALTTSIPAQASRTAPLTAADVLVTVHENTVGSTGAHYYHTFAYADRSAFGYGTTWYGLLNIKQGSADDPRNPGIGGNFNTCAVNSKLVAGDAYSWPDGNLEIYWGDAKNVQGNGAGGTLCQPSGPTSAYRMRIWVR